MKESDVLAKIETALRACLHDVPFVRLKRIEIAPVIEPIPTVPNGRPDFVARLELPEGEWSLLVEARGSGEPRLAREAANQLARYCQSLPGSYGLFAAPYISPRA